MRVILTGDDYGFTSGVNRGFRELFAVGVAMGASVMVGGLAVEEAVAIAKEQGVTSRCGLHLTLHSLRAGDPYMRKGDYARLLETASAEELWGRIEREIEHFMCFFGHLPAYRDSHQKIHQHPKVLAFLYPFAVAQGIPLRYVPGLPSAVSRTAACISGSSLSLAVLYEQLDALQQAGVASVELVFHPGYVDAPLRQYSQLLEEREKDREKIRALDQWL
ncbi:ChbG/HpnK family deacetylase [Candidatus Peribacteria bacterium]|nr:ChbG/HpnK family deacetylase [Candidatus Peribacteria bacterium]